MPSSCLDQRRGALVLGGGRLLAGLLLADHPVEVAQLVLDPLALGPQLVGDPLADRGALGADREPAGALAGQVGQREIGAAGLGRRVGLRAALVLLVRAAAEPGRDVRLLEQRRPQAAFCAVAADHRLLDHDVHRRAVALVQLDRDPAVEVVEDVAEEVLRVGVDHAGDRRDQVAVAEVALLDLRDRRQAGEHRPRGRVVAIEPVLERAVVGLGRQVGVGGAHGGIAAAHAATAEQP
jgi:hypothetical protein